MTINTLGYALLALLARGERSGYELVKLLRRPIGYFWTAQQSQVYPELARLAGAGLVTFAVGYGPGPREKKTYSITDTGRAALAAWLPMRPEPSQPRSELLVKTFGIGAADPALMHQLYLDLVSEYAERTGELEEQMRQLASEGARSLGHPKFGNYATVRLGVAASKLNEEWCGWMAAQLEPPVTGDRESVDD